MHYLLTFFFVLFLVANTPDAVAETVEQKILQRTLQNYIQPQYQNLAQKTQYLKQTVALLCQLPSESNLQKTHNAFFDLVEAWGQIEWLQIGPVMQQNRLERFFFFPDRKSIGLRQVQSLLSKKQSEVLTLASLQNMSVAVQGIGALDYLLFDDANTLTIGDNFRCQYIHTITENLHQLATQLEKKWTEDKQLVADFLRPSPHNSQHLSDKVAMNTLVSTITKGLEGIRKSRIEIFFRSPAKKDRPKLAPLWWSQSTMRLIASNLQGLEQLFVQSQISMLLSSTNKSIQTSLIFDFNQSIKATQSLDAPIASILNNDEQRDKLRYIRLSITFLIDRLNNDFLPATGLATGFSYGDGD